MSNLPLGENPVQVYVAFEEKLRDLKEVLNTRGWFLSESSNPLLSRGMLKISIYNKDIDNNALSCFEPLEHWRTYSDAALSDLSILIGTPTRNMSFNRLYNRTELPPMLVFRLILTLNKLSHNNLFLPYMTVNDYQFVKHLWLISFLSDGDSLWTHLNVQRFNEAFTFLAAYKIPLVSKEEAQKVLEDRSEERQ